MITDQEKKWWSGDIKAEYYCDECECEFNTKTLIVSHMDTIHAGDSPTPNNNTEREKVEVKSDKYVIKKIP